MVLSLVFILFSIYGLHNSKTVTLEDDGLFIMASLDGGRSSPGLPLFTFLGQLFFSSPGIPGIQDSPAERIVGALACGVLYLVIVKQEYPVGFLSLQLSLTVFLNISGHSP